MEGLLSRIGVDQAYGGWNAPVDEETGEFVFVPIPDGKNKQYPPGLRISYQQSLAELKSFAQKKGFTADLDLFTADLDFGSPKSYSIDVRTSILISLG